MGGGVGQLEVGGGGKERGGFSSPVPNTDQQPHTVALAIFVYRTCVVSVGRRFRDPLPFTIGENRLK